jgi:predicted transposase/invertase (TIGR01784 family)
VERVKKMRKVNPLNDLVFKKTMGEPGDEVQLKSFLEAVLGRKLKNVEIIEAVDLMPDIIGDKLSRLDVRAKTDDNTEINIEVQLKDHSNMNKRSLFYWGRLFSKALKSGNDNDYIKLPNIVTINILIRDALHRVQKISETERERHSEQRCT